MAATVVLNYYNSTGPTATDATTGVKWNREDTQVGTTPVPVPSSTGTNFSWYKTLAFAVTVTSTTSINARTISSAAAPTGVAIMAKDAGTSYVQATSGNKPADAGTAANTPTGYTALTNYAGGTNAALVWDNTGVSTGSTGRNGDYVLVACGVDSTYAGGGGSANTGPTLTLSYTEA